MRRFYSGPRHFVHVKIRAISLYPCTSSHSDLWSQRKVVELLEPATVTTLRRLPFAGKSLELRQILRGTHHDDQNQGHARRDACSLFCARCHGAPAYSSRTHRPLARDPSVWQRLSLWQRLPVVSKPRIRSHPSALHSLSRLGLRNRRRPRPISSMRDGGRLTHS